MTYTLNTGWRKPSPLPTPLPSPELEASKEDLFAAMRLAIKARRLRPASRQLLDHLVGCYGGAKIAGLFLVWPSNEFLMERTGLTERSVRYGLRELITTGLIASRDSANGKRFAVRTANGQIKDAYGFDLSPLLLRQSEHQAVADRLAAEQRLRDAQFDEITICRRKSQELLMALDAWSDDAAPLPSAFEALCRRTPRRGSSSPLASLVAEWRALMQQLEAQYIAASDGKNCRHIEDNKDAPDQSCSNGQEKGDVATAEVKMSDVLVACPDAAGYCRGELTRPEHLVVEAARLRGGFGISQDAWVEARTLLGAGAGAAFFVALQIYENDQRNKAQIRNFGAYFRALARKFAAGSMSLSSEIADLKRKRRH